MGSVGNSNWERLLRIEGDRWKATRIFVLGLLLLLVVLSSVMVSPSMDISSEEDILCSLVVRRVLLYVITAVTCVAELGR